MCIANWINYTKIIKAIWQTDFEIYFLNGAFYWFIPCSVGFNWCPRKPNLFMCQLVPAVKWRSAFIDLEYSLQWALLHELGHAIGLRHSSNKEDIMFSKLQATKAILGAGDILAVQNYYGYSIMSK